MVDERRGRTGRRIPAVAGRSQPRAVAARRQHRLVGRAVNVVGAVVAVAAAAGVAQVLRQLGHTGRVHQLLHLSEATVSEDAEELVLAALNELLVDELLVVATVAVEAELSCSHDSDDDGGGAEAEEDAEEIVFVDGWVDDGLTDDVDQFGPELVEAFFKPDQRQDGVVDLSEAKTD